MKFCNIQQSTNNIEIVYRDYWKNVITKNKIYFQSNWQIPTRQNYYLLMKLGNILRVEILNLNFSIKDGIKNVKRLKRKMVSI